ncbi:MAG: ATP-binding protein [Planctomycetes bacterium]|nr:ATP-binding protein [Planctomycetota bacterium]
MKLVIRSGKRRGQIFNSDGRTVTIGRDPSCTIRLDDSRASRQHALIEPAENGTWICRDLQSTNSTLVNEKEITTALLKDGDVIRIGSTEILCQMLPEASGSANPEIALAVNRETIELTLRSSSQLTPGRKSLQEVLFRLGLIADPALPPAKFIGKAMQILAESVPFATWALLTWKQGATEPAAVIGERLGRPVGAAEILRCSRLIERATRSRTGLIAGSRDCPDDPHSADAAIGSALAVPINAANNEQNVLYLDRGPEMEPFRREDLEQIVVIALHLQVDLQNIDLYLRLQGAFEDLRRSQSDLVRTEKMAAIGRLASGFAHDLNNPLSSLIGFLDLATRLAAKSIDEKAVEKLKRYLSRAHDAADYCQALSRNLLAFARQSPGGSPASKDYDVRATVDATINICDAALQRCGARVAIDVPNGLTLRGDPSALQQVLMNLLTNAADALCEVDTERARQIQVVARREDEGATIAVSDNGPGIPAELHERIFEPLFTTKASDRGTGLGLFVVRRIVLESGGKIELTSRPGTGSTFQIHLPSRQLGVAPDAVPPRQPAVIQGSRDS